MNQVNVDNAMKEIVTTLQDNVGIFAEDSIICVSVWPSDAVKVEKALINNNIEFTKDTIGGVSNYTFKGEYE